VCHDISLFGHLALMSMGSVLAATVIYSAGRLRAPTRSGAALLPHEAGVGLLGGIREGEDDEGRGKGREREGGNRRREMEEWEGTAGPVKV